MIPNFFSKSVKVGNFLRSAYQKITFLGSLFFTSFASFCKTSEIFFCWKTTKVDEEALFYEKKLSPSQKAFLPTVDEGKVPTDELCQIDSLNTE